MKPYCCKRCGSLRDPVLLGILPCEYCGTAPDDIETMDLPSDDSWGGQLGRRRWVEKVVERPEEEES